jgi:hypothetical protein
MLLIVLGTRGVTGVGRDPGNYSFLKTLVQRTEGMPDGTGAPICTERHSTAVSSEGSLNGPALPAVPPDVDTSAISIPMRHRRRARRDVYNRVMVTIAQISNPWLSSPWLK